MGRGLERVAWWVIGTRIEAERQELRAEPDSVVKVDPSGPNSCLEPEIGRPDVMGSESNDWLVEAVFQGLYRLRPITLENPTKSWSKE
jgi:hypothetical protein